MAGIEKGILVPKMKNKIILTVPELQKIKLYKHDFSDQYYSVRPADGGGIVYCLCEGFKTPLSPIYCKKQGIEQKYMVDLDLYENPEKLPNQEICLRFYFHKPHFIFYIWPKNSRSNLLDILSWPDEYLKININKNPDMVLEFFH